MAGDTLEEKRKKLAALKAARSGAHCSKTVSKASDVYREEKIEDLEAEIRKLEQKSTT